MSIKKVIQLSSWDRDCSDGFVVRSIAEKARKSGFRVINVYCGNGDDGVDSYHLGNIKSSFLFKVTPKFLRRIYLKDGFSHTSKSRKVLEILEKEKPDIIHLHQSYNGFINFKKINKYAKKNNCKIIITFHDHWWISGGCAVCHNGLCEKYLCGCKGCPDKKRSLIGLYSMRHSWKLKRKLVFANPNVFFASTSEELKNKAIQSRLCTPLQIGVFPNGVNSNNFFLESETKCIIKGLENKEFVFACAGYWNESKGIKILEKLSLDLEKRRIPFAIVGADFDDSNFAKSTIMVKHPFNPPELRNLFNHAKVYVNPSKMEACCFTNLEAALCGCNIVSFDIGGSINLISKNRVKLVKNYDYDLFLKSTIESFNNKKVPVDDLEISKYGINAYEKYIKLYKVLTEKSITFNNIVSLGYDCNVAKDLEHLGLRNFSLPFDWIKTPFASCVSLIKNNFKRLFEKKNFEHIADNTNEGVYKNKIYNILFLHDFKNSFDFDYNFENVKAKYNKRIARFYSIIKKPTLFVRYIKDCDEAKYIDENKDEILNILKQYNSQNEIVYITTHKATTADFYHFSIASEIVEYPFFFSEHSIDYLLHLIKVSGFYNKKNYMRYLKKNFPTRKEYLISRLREKIYGKKN